MKVDPHPYFPDDAQYAGDCRVCGHVFNDPIHHREGGAMPAGSYVTRESLRHSLTNQPPRDAAIVDRFEKLREPAIEFGEAIFDLCPESRERSVALTKLEEAVMWAIKSIALNQGDIPA